MPNDPAYLRSLKKITRSHPTLGQIIDLEREIYGTGNDRACVVLMGAFVETQIEQLLATKVRRDLNSTDRSRLFDYDGPMGNFSSKILMAYALNLIGPITRHDLDLIRHLRNEFAHSRVPLTLETPEVAAVCDQLKILDQPGSVNAQAMILSSRKLPRDPRHPRTRFLGTTHNLGYRMIVAIHGPREGDSVFPDDNPVP